MLTPGQSLVLALLRHVLADDHELVVVNGIDVADVAIAIRRGGTLTTVCGLLVPLPQVRDLLTSECYATISQSVN